jgi:hypothetical protein
MTQPTKNKIPGPVYAAAGAGDLAYQRLRKLPAVLSELTGKAAAGTAELRERAIVNSAELRERFVAGAQTAQGKATAVYEDLVTRGVQVIGHSAETGAGTGSAAIAPTGEPAALAPGKKATTATKATKRR